MPSVKMPEPVAHRWRVPLTDSVGTQGGESDWKYGINPSLLPWWTKNALITTDQAEAYAAAKVAEAQAWQPIETAPKDGTEILLSNGAEVEQGYWMHIEGGITEHRDLDGRYIGQDEDEGYIGWWDFSGGMQPEPTHWMPRPPPPQHDN